MSTTLHDVRTHNLHGLTLTLPDTGLVAVTGPSGSGKSSLVMDTLHAEAQRRFLALLDPHARRRLARLPVGELARATGLRPSVGVGQAGVVHNPRLTVGTLWGALDLLRVLVAHGGGVRPGLLSFNGRGACPACRGLGVRDTVDPELLVADASRTLREGALVPTTPTGYIVYSQVTVDALDTVCRAHSFDVDTPWSELTEDQRDVVLSGSDRVIIPYGKHTLESRLRWEGITARPRQEGHYKGIVPVIQQILDTKPNANARRFARTRPCPACGGSRLGPEGRAARLGRHTLPELARLDLRELRAWVAGLDPGAPLGPVAAELASLLELTVDLGLGHLTLGRASSTLSAGETRRLRLAAQVHGGLSGTTVVLDEPSAGLHPTELARLVRVLGRLAAAGQRAVVVEHDPLLLGAAGHLVELGPGGGSEGGRLLYEGPVGWLPAGTPTGDALRASLPAGTPRPGTGALTLLGASGHTLDRVDLPLRLGALNVVTGPSGAGKTTLAVHTLAPAVARALGRSSPPPLPHAGLTGAEAVGEVVLVDASPLGRTPRSNPATYTKAWDAVRRHLAALPEAKERGLGVGHFSFNKAEGRCPECEGAGVHVVGMHLLPDALVPCSACGGRRFADAVLEVRHEGLDVAAILDLTVAEAVERLAGIRGATAPLEALRDVGLGYLTLGQPSPTLSGGEAQRVRLAAHLVRRSRRTLFVLDEPTLGLHPRDVGVLLSALQRLVDAGHTVVAADHDLHLVAAADHVAELDSGRVVAAGADARTWDTATGRALRGEVRVTAPPPASPPGAVELTGVRTHNLQGVDLTVPHGSLTVLTGPSGSGKSSLAFDTLFAEAHRRMVQSLSAHARRAVRQLPPPDLDRARGLLPAVAVRQAAPGTHPGSTVATATGVHELLRLLWSRAGDTRLPASAFSHHHPAGACPACEGRGVVLRANPDLVVRHPERSVLDGALDGTRGGKPYADPHDRWQALLRVMAPELGLERPWRDLTPAARAAVWEGTGERVWEATWSFRRGKRTGTHALSEPWPGLAWHLEDEHRRRRGSRRGDDVAALLSPRPCTACAGTRLQEAPRSALLAGHTLPEVLQQPLCEARAFVEALPTGPVVDPIRARLRPLLRALGRLRLDYLALDREVSTLSAGESRRVQLCAAVSDALDGLLLVLDEPTRGLHPRDRDALVGVLLELRGRHTLVVVEHDPAVVAVADHEVALGPGGGEDGGRVVYAGPPRAAPVACAERARRQPAGVLAIEGARAHNLDLSVDLGTGVLTAVTGVSGSGKSTLVFDVLAATARAGHPVGCDAIRGLDAFADVRSTERPATGSPAERTGVLQLLRQQLARAGGVRPAALSWSSPRGACPTCKGSGREKVHLGLLADAWSPCPACGGARLRPEALAHRWHGRSLPELLGLTVRQALALDEPVLARPLGLLLSAGLGHVRLGQRALSGGERGRLALVASLVEQRRGATLHLLDEPEAGLSPAEVGALAARLHELVDAGDTVVAVTHHPGLVAQADRVIELGPGAGAAGGRLVG